jgi:hypothetical protein
MRGLKVLLGTLLLGGFALANPLHHMEHQIKMHKEHCHHCKNKAEEITLYFTNLATLKEVCYYGSIQDFCQKGCEVYKSYKQLAHRMGKGFKNQFGHIHRYGKSWFANNTAQVCSTVCALIPRFKISLHCDGVVNPPSNAGSSNVNSGKSGGTEKVLLWIEH